MCVCVRVCVSVCFCVCVSVPECLCVSVCVCRAHAYIARMHICDKRHNVFLRWLYVYVCVSVCVCACSSHQPIHMCDITSCMCVCVCVCACVFRNSVPFLPRPHSYVWHNFTLVAWRRPTHHHEKALTNLHSRFASSHEPIHVRNMTSYVWLHFIRHTAHTTYEKALTNSHNWSASSHEPIQVHDMTLHAWHDFTCVTRPTCYMKQHSRTRILTASASRQCIYTRDKTWYVWHDIHMKEHSRTCILNTWFHTCDMTYTWKSTHELASASSHQHIYMLDKSSYVWHNPHNTMKEHSRTRILDAV